ncbi:MULTISPECIES: LuxR C-terminal-related transcriptional regulator [Dyella]|uniref:LuxR family transcriptional regulator n=2 Tax=Dyella TaxID=231454 RepID=A0A4R0YU99_9GAMM|nr:MULTISPECIES: LuxR C-terminal-related transcriptional regulator [Dyella]TBR39418.1 LuxR family transcriptional regulator [Dyella terrae]TCI12995.1 LuxR family transcriptional regulator [Dyella soli]
MALTAGGAAPAIAELVLKTTPPRAPRYLLVRPRLGLDDEQFRERPFILVQAPAGFGKTSLLAQWRHEYLARGWAVAWISADGSPDPQRMLHSLVLAVRMGCGRPQFGATLLESASVAIGEYEGVTAWLSEVAQAPLSMVLMIDEAERLHPGSQAALNYLLHNAPPNLRVVAAGRSDLASMVADLEAYGLSTSVGVETLRFTLEETIGLVRNRIGAKADPDTCARLHELTEGWPLGLQLVLAAMERGSDLRSVVGPHSPDSRNQLVEALTAKLAPEDVAFLTRVAVVDQLHPDLCVALTGDQGAPQRLARLARETPIFVVGEDSDWYRLHLLALDALRLHLAELPEWERDDLHGRAQDWLAAHGMLTQAARHAREAGREGVAVDLAQKGLYEAVIQGHMGTMREWLDVLPESVLDQHPQLRLAAAWSLAVSERHEEAERMVGLILSRPDVNLALRYECVLIASGAAYYADDPDRCVGMLAPWKAAPPAEEPKFQRMHINRLAMMALLQGDPAEARRLCTTPGTDLPREPDYAIRWRDFIIGLSFVWEGQILLAEEGLRAALVSIDAKFGRRHPLSCMFAALLASIAYERDHMDEAVALLANRLDVLERVGAPESILVGYRTVTRVAAAQGEEHRALDILEASFAIGAARRLPRLCIASLGEQVRMHASRFRRETCSALIARIDEMVASESPGRGPLWRRNVEMVSAMAHAYSAMAAQDWPGVLESVARAAPLAEQAHLGRFRIECMALRAFALDRNGEDGRTLMIEAMSLARTYGFVRLFTDTHPVLTDWAYRVMEEASGEPATVAASPSRVIPPPMDQRQGGPRVMPSMVLTPKEREVLEFLARNLSNKEIAQAMAVGEATVKWHLKNLFGKLGVGTRRHVVHRAQLLGLIQGLE